jgi:hypothetical protein
MMKKNKKVSQKKQSKSKFKTKLRKAIQKNLMVKAGFNARPANIAASLIVGLVSIVSGVLQKYLAPSLNDHNQNDSNVRAIQRFLSSTYLDYRLYSQMLFSMLQINEKVTIVIDRTNWDFGKKHINIFAAGILVKSHSSNQYFAVPIVWEVFEKKGITNTEERKQLMNKIIALIGVENIAMILADREFIGEAWIQYLYRNAIPFIIRTRNNMYVEHDGEKVKTSDLFAELKYQEKRMYQVQIDGIPVTLAGAKSVDGELVIAMASRIEGDPLSAYRLRWLIELFFKSIKSGSFNLEQTHMTDPARIKMLFALIAYATILAVQAGKARDQHKKIKTKNHGRPAVSLFTYGLSLLRSLIHGVIPKELHTLFESDPTIHNLHFLCISGG